jgi:hypothetical protein
MTTTTSYGTWNDRVEPHSANFSTSVYEALGDFADDYDTDAIEADYRNAINEALPDGVSLCGDEFIGPAYDADFDGYPTDEYGRLDIRTIVESVDFWEIVSKHDTSA